jgi:hypothetical protein
MLETSDILTAETTDGNPYSIHNLVAPLTAIRAFAQIFNKTQCDINHDYDCDGLDNAKDNCPFIYNPSQRNFDQDRDGDVCDSDTDNDGITNPIGIIDES